MLPSARSRARSPVRYSRAPGWDENGSLTNFCSGQLGMIEITSRQAISADPELSCGPRRHRVTGGIEQVHGCVGNRAADRNRSVRLFRLAHAMTAGKRRALGRTVSVDDHAVVEAFERL